MAVLPEADSCILVSPSFSPSATDIVSFNNLRWCSVGSTRCTSTVMECLEELLDQTNIDCNHSKRGTETHFLMMDPAAGVVSVVLHNVQLDLGFMMELATTYKSLTPRVLPRIDDRIDGAGWIVLVKLNLPIRRREDKSVQRFVMDSTFQFESRGLECDWPTFVFLCLGLDVDPYRGGLQNLDTTEGKIHNLTDANGRTVMRVYPGEHWFTYLRTAKGHTTTFSERRAMVSVGMMLLPCDKGHHWVSLDVPLAAFLITYRGNLDLHMSQMLSELGRALKWHFYALSVFQAESEISPTPEFILKAIERLANQLRSVPKRKIRATLEDIFSDAWRIEMILLAVEARLGRLTSRKHTIHHHSSGLISIVEHDFTDACQNDQPFTQLANMFSPFWQFKRHLLPLNDLEAPVAICSRILLLTSPCLRSLKVESIYDLEWTGTNHAPNNSYPKSLMQLLESPRLNIYIR